MVTKPRLHVPWTEEDEEIQWRNTVRHDRQHQFGFRFTRDLDRRDADLMLELAEEKVWFGRFLWPESLYDQYLADGGDGLNEWPDPPHQFREVT